MNLKFTGTFDEFKAALSSVETEGEWIDLNANQKQFRHTSGGVLNWYPSTGTINFQGRGNGPGELSHVVSALLGVDTVISERFPNIDEAHRASPEEQRPVAATHDNREMLAVTLGNRYSDSELVIALVGAVGTEMDNVVSILSGRLGAFGYTAEEIKVSRDVIAELSATEARYDSEYDRVTAMMRLGNEARLNSADYSILAMGVAAKINRGRDEGSPGRKLPRKRRAYIINSLKHPAEVQRLREIYSLGFFAVGVYADEKRRYDYLVRDRRMTTEQAQKLIATDAHEQHKYGQHTSDTFHLSDFFIHFDGNFDKMKNDVWRLLDLMFGRPHVTPTFDEFAMFMAFSSALRSADLSRQVGALVARDNQILAVGANDTPRFGGGLYWAEYDPVKLEIADAPDGRDYMRGQDSNAVEKRRIIDDILNNVGELGREKFEAALRESRLMDITEYGRVVHAEMEAILSCARNNVSTKDAALYCTTFPCHNCAKHIIAAGIKRVVYVEPYPKSKALEFHSDSVSLGFGEKRNTVAFEPFVGVGPRSFFNLFSMNIGAGTPLKRKDVDGYAVGWQPEAGRLRMQMLPNSYIERESEASDIVEAYKGSVRATRTPSS